MSLIQSPDNLRKVYFNKTQLRTIITNARITVCSMGRGTGKTEGIQAYMSSRNMFSMPECVGAFLAQSERKIMAEELPNIIAGWKRLGYEQDVHFVVGERPPKSWPRSPLFPQKDYKMFISWITGSGIQLLSMQKGVDHSGPSNAFIHVSEAKKIDGKKFMHEMVPTLRGWAHKFGHLPECHSILLTSDKLLNEAGDSDWFFKYKEQHDQDMVNLILQMHVFIEKLRIDKAPQAQIDKYTQQMRELQKACINYAEASSFDNIEILGEEVLENWYKNLPPNEFNSAVLNKDGQQVKGGFYNGLMDELHGYSAYNTDMGIGAIIDRNDPLARGCKYDDDLRPDRNLKISIDWGGWFNSATVVQEDDEENRLLKNFFVYSPKKYQDLVKEIIMYYRFHPTKVVELYYDPSGNKEKENSITTNAEDVIAIFRKNGWAVINKYDGIMKYIGHHDKHRIWAKVLDEGPNRDPRYKRFRFNKDNAWETFISMSRAKIKIVGRDIRKNKNMEANRDYPQEYATHLSDSVDNIICYDHYFIEGASNSGYGSGAAIR